VTESSSLPWPLCVPVLTDGEIVLRAHTPADVGALVEMGTDEQMQRFTTVPTPYTRRDAEDFIHHLMPEAWAKGTREWAIELDGRFAGNVGLRAHGAAAEIAFALHPWARGQGVMKRAAGLAMEWAFTEGEVELIGWRAAIGNVASLRVAHSLGFSLDAAVPKEHMRAGQPLGLWFGHFGFGDAPLPRTPWLDPRLNASDDVQMRPLSEADADALIAINSDPLAQHYLANLAWRYARTEALEQIHDATWRAARGSDVNWAVVNGDDAMIGLVTLMDVATDRELSYAGHPRVRGQGVMTQAVRCVVDWATSQDGLDAPTLLIRSAASNAASRAIAVRAGFTEAGLLHSAEPLGDGSRDDLVIYEFVR
jgi:[ribosomal protein S5]-alanine N-acetyltransferase